MVKPGKETMRIGLAGLGTASPEILEELANHPNIELGAACDVRVEARTAFSEQYGLACYSSVLELAESPDVDAVYVATPSPMHCEHVVACAERGKDVIVEKPVALTIAECDDMIAAADLTGSRILAGHTHSFDATVQEMARIVNAGLIGQPYMLHQWYYTDWMFRGRMPDELDTDLGGGVVFRQGPHSIDMARLLMSSDIVSVDAKTVALDSQGSAMGGFVAYLKFASGGVATIVFSGHAYFDSSELTWGIGEAGYSRSPLSHVAARGRIRELGNLKREAEYKDSMRFGGQNVGQWLADSEGPSTAPRKHGFYGLTIVSGPKGDMRQTPDGVMLYADRERREINVPLAANPREAELSVLFDAWSTGSQLESHDLRWARGTLAVCLAIVESARNGWPVDMSDYVGGRVEGIA